MSNALQSPVGAMCLRGVKALGWLLLFFGVGIAWTVMAVVLIAVPSARLSADLLRIHPNSVIPALSFLIAGLGIPFFGAGVLSRYLKCNRWLTISASLPAVLWMTVFVLLADCYTCSESTLWVRNVGFPLMPILSQAMGIVLSKRQIAPD